MNGALRLGAHPADRAPARPPRISTGRFHTTAPWRGKAPRDLTSGAPRKSSSGTGSGAGAGLHPVMNPEASFCSKPQGLTSATGPHPAAAGLPIVAACVTSIEYGGARSVPSGSLR